jgi:putative endonuclease
MTKRLSLEVVEIYYADYSHLVISTGGRELLRMKAEDLNVKHFVRLRLHLLMNHNYFIYITTNPSKTVLYIGVTNDLTTRLSQHYENRGKADSFAGRYYCHNLIYWERFQYIEHAIEREKEIKKWSRAKKESLIASFNPTWRFLNDEVV